MNNQSTVSADGRVVFLLFKHNNDEIGAVCRFWFMSFRNPFQVLSPC